MNLPEAKLRAPDIGGSVAKSQSIFKTIEVLLVIGIVLASFATLGIVGFVGYLKAKESATKSTTQLQTRQSSRKETIVAPVGEWSSPKNIVGEEGAIAYGGPVLLRVKRFNGEIEEFERSDSAPPKDLGKVKEFSLKSNSDHPITNWWVRDK